MALNKSISNPIMFIGGCHVTGYPFEGMNGSFSEIACNLMGVPLSSNNMMSLVTLTSISTVMKELENKSLDTLVLQLGNFETSRGFSVSPLSRRKAPTPKERSEVKLPSSTPEIQSFKAYRPSLIWDITNLLRLQLSIFLGDSYFSEEVFYTKLYNFCEAISLLKIPQVILLSPLPCADRVFQRNRKIVSKFYPAIAAKFGFTYVDAITPLMLESSKYDIYADAFHLSLKGHKILGNLVANSIR